MALGRRLASIARLHKFNAKGAALSLGLAGGGASLSTRGFLEEKMDARKLVWLQTVALANTPAAGSVDPELTKKSVQGTKLYESKGDELWAKRNGGSWEKMDIPQSGESYNTQIEVVNQDSFVAAKHLVDAGYRPVVLNMANKLSVGGGVEHGSPAQEECLFRASNYFQSLYPWGEKCTSGPRKDRVLYREQIPEFGSYYSPSVQVFRDGGASYAIIPRFTVDCIAVAGYDLRTQALNAKPEELYQPDAGVKGKTGEELVKAFSEGTRKKIKHVLDVALVEGNDSLVLGAISCGAFAMEGKGEMMPVWVSEAIYDVLNDVRYSRRFRAVKIAVLSAGQAGKTNFEVFQSRFSAQRPKL